MEIYLIRNCTTDPTCLIDPFRGVEDKFRREYLPSKRRVSQRAPLQTIAKTRQVVLKVRLLGFTWLIVCCILWVILFRPDSAILSFSRPDTGASLLLEHISAVLPRLPMNFPAEATVEDNTELFVGTTGPSAACFSTTKHSRHSYNTTPALPDQADCSPNFKAQPNAVKPTKAGGYTLFILSTAIQQHPGSEFNHNWSGALKSLNQCRNIVLPRDAHPGPGKPRYTPQHPSCTRYSPAITLLEPRNNAHAVLLPLEYSQYEHIHLSPINQGPDQLSNRRHKVLAVDLFAQALTEPDCPINNGVLLSERPAIDASTLNPTGRPQDHLATALITALPGSHWHTNQQQHDGQVSAVVTNPTILENLSS